MSESKVEPSRNCYKIKFLALLGQRPGVIETNVKEFKIGVQNELRGKGYFITIDPHFYPRVQS